MARAILVPVLLLAVALAAGAEEEKENPVFPVGTSVHGGESGPRFVVHVPESFGTERKKGERWPALVALHEIGGDGATAAAAWKGFAAEGRYLLLCPKSAGLAFAESDLPAVLEAAKALGKELPVSSLLLAGIGDAGFSALTFALRRPREFAGALAIGTDVPDVDPARSASHLKLLVMKRVDDRPGAGRESVEAIRGKLGRAEFRAMAESANPMDPAGRAYAIHFLDAAAGRCVAGRDRSLAWRDGAAGLAFRRARKLPALVYLWDAGAAFRKRTEKIQLEVLFDPDLRAAAEEAEAVPVLAPRSLAAKLLPGARIPLGPSLVVLDRKGEVVGVLSKKLSARAICALLKGL